MYLNDPGVARNIRAAIAKKHPDFKKWRDLDDDFLFNHLFEEVWKGKYDPSKCAPPTYAMGVAKRRLIDIWRKRSKLELNKNKAIDEGHYTVGGIWDDKTVEEQITEIRVMVTDTLKQRGIAIRPKRFGHVYLDRSQRIALYILQQRMGWSYREAERQLSNDPGALKALGVAHAPDHTFFCRVAHLVKKIPTLGTPVLVSPE